MKRNLISEKNSKQDRDLMEKYPSYREFFLKPSSQIEDYQSELSSLAQTDFCRTILNGLLKELNLASSQLPVSGTTELPIFIFKYFALVLKIIQPHEYELAKKAGSHLSSLANNSILRVSGESTLGVELYEESPERLAEEFDPKLKLNKKGKQVLESGQGIHLKSGKDVLRFYCPQGKPALALILQDQKSQTILWAYDAKSLKPKQAFSSTQGVSRIEMSANFLGSIQDRAALPILESLMNHAEHFIRWTAIKNILRIDLVQGQAALVQGSRDPHPHVRRASQKTLENLDQSIREDQ